ncbi:LysR family transcriptional regulator [Amycolatopsis sp. SID8362]|uniref:LysR family transcriptional regulator n=1 Tax=Amycolatopsis sp. SID8362 TaxID=2690346 RepID=UPI00136CB413|nr:LysR family transcriptional regulator [Amycolatopsis sp. SID8362]NBH12122.1 LysR family transcriptional regulator [Amycolatopsis sp. SID8362]NED48814.1 LysR family transcriptional regulator [Amycolatopsis sp. SID8362]
MELRDIEIFLTLAEELHFGRTAERLHVSQARISQAIGHQERRLGALLFDRANRRVVRLTPVGRQLRDDLRPVYADLRDSLERARLAARGITAVLRVGVLPHNGHDLRPHWDAFRSRHPQWNLRIQYAPFVDPFAGLRRGDVDVLVAWLPVEEADLTVGPVLFTEPRVIAVAGEHELAGRPSVSLDMISHFRFPSIASAPAYWIDSYLPPRTPQGRPIERGPLVRNNEQVLALVSVGEIVTPYPRHMSRYGVRPDIAYLPIRDIDAIAYALVWQSESENDLIRALARTIGDIGPLGF